MTSAPLQSPVVPRPSIRFAPEPPNAWIPAVLVLLLAAALVLQFPAEALVFHARTIPRGTPTAAFVSLDAEAYAATMRSVQTAWQVGRRTPGALELDLGGAALGAVRPVPRFLVRAPVASVGMGRDGAAALATTVRPLTPPTLAAPSPDALPAEPVGLACDLSPELASAGFAFPAPDAMALPTSRGVAAFEVRTERTGGVETVLILPGAPRAAADILRRALARGRAAHATNGFIHIEWNRPSGSVSNPEGKVH